MEKTTKIKSNTGALLTYIGTYINYLTQSSIHKMFFISRTDMQLDEGFWMRWSDNFGRTFDGGRVVIPVRKNFKNTFFALEFSIFFTTYLLHNFSERN